MLTAPRAEVTVTCLLKNIFTRKMHFHVGVVDDFSSFSLPNFSLSHIFLFYEKVCQGWRHSFECFTSTGHIVNEKVENPIPINPREKQQPVVRLRLWCLDKRERRSPAES